MSFTLTGFKEEDGVRRFAFQYVSTDRSRTRVLVGADVALARNHQIRLQDLPLICLRLLESLGDEALNGPVTLTEDRMIQIQTEARMTAEKRYKPPRRTSPAVGQAWRRGAPA